MGEAADGHEALSLAAELKPEVVLADINMPGPSGIQVARELQRTQPEARVLILTMHEDPTLLREAMQAGAAGYVVKRAVETDLVAAIRSWHRAKYISTRICVFGFAHYVGSEQKQPWIERDLSDAELDLLCLLVAGAHYPSDCRRTRVGTEGRRRAPGGPTEETGRDVPH